MTPETASMDVRTEHRGAREQLDGKAFSSGWNTGQAMSEEQAIADALDGPELRKVLQGAEYKA